MPDVTTAAGDCFNRIAKANGFFNYLTVYQHADNATQFPSPNHVAVGATVKVPDKKMAAFDVRLDKETKFNVIRQKCKLRIKLCEADVAKVLSTANVLLTVGTKTAKSAKSGLLEIEDVDANETAATLVVTLSNPPAFKKPPATPKVAADAYPPRVLHEEFDDPAPDWPAKGDTVTWTIEVGSLEPHTTVKGVLQRLSNLGFTCPVQAAEDAATQLAVRTYRRSAEDKKPPDDTTAVDDIRAHLKARHDD